MTLGEWLEEAGVTNHAIGPSWLWPFWRMVGPLIRRPIQQWMMQVWACPNCSYYLTDDYEPFLTVTGSGQHFTGDYTCHWFRGFLTCPRCRYQWDYEDSD